MVAIRAIEQEQTVEVIALLEALLSQCKLSAHQSDVANLSELFRRALTLSNFVSFFDSVKLEGQVELVVFVRSKVKSHRLLAIRLQKLGKLSKVALGYGANQTLSLFRVSLQNSILVIDHGQEKPMCVYVEGLVDKVESRLFSIVA